MDFIDRLKDAVNTLSIPIKMRTGYLSDKETLVIYSLPGSAVITQYMDGTRDVNMNYEIAMKSKDGAKIEQTLWQVQDYLDTLLDVTSKNNSFEFNGLTITSKPFINDADEQGWFVFLLDFTANLTIY